jgi:hypothetical protein
MPEKEIKVKNIVKNGKQMPFGLGWCPCGCGRQITRQESDEMEKGNWAHTTTKES